MEDRITNAFDIELPVTIVELEHLKTKTGERVRVRCEAVDELDAAKAYGMPGQHGANPDGSSSSLDVINIVDKVAPVLIHGATVLADADGNHTIRPAFHFDEEHRVNGSIPARYLRMSDKMALITAILHNSGLGGAASEASFLSRDREGLPLGVGVVEDVPSDGASSI